MVVAVVGLVDVVAVDFLLYKYTPPQIKRAVIIKPTRETPAIPYGDKFLKNDSTSPVTLAGDGAGAGAGDRVGFEDGAGAGAPGCFNACFLSGGGIGTFGATGPTGTTGATGATGPILSFGDAGPVCGG